MPQYPSTYKPSEGAAIIEKKIGTSPFKGMIDGLQSVLNPTTNTYEEVHSDNIRNWCLLQGMSAKKLAGCSGLTFRKIYNIPSYFSQVYADHQQGRPNSTYIPGKKRQGRPTTQPKPAPSLNDASFDDDDEPETNFDGGSQPPGNHPLSNEEYAAQQATYEAEQSASFEDRDSSELLQAFTQKLRSYEERNYQRLNDLQTAIDRTNSKIAKIDYSSEIQEIRGDMHTLAENIGEAIRLEVERRIPVEVHIKDTSNNNIAILPQQHELFPKFLRMLNARDKDGNKLNLWLTGPSGSGKTAACKFASVALEKTFTSYRKSEDGKWKIYNEADEEVTFPGLDNVDCDFPPFGADSSLDADYKVVGNLDGHGIFHWTTFLRCYVYGGIYVADEIDSWYPPALVALNAALANGFISTPIGIMRRHKDFSIVACANTWGNGATFKFTGRAKIDAATLNRFPTKMHWYTDEKLETSIASNLGFRDWCNIVQKARKTAEEGGLEDVTITPRNTFDGIALLQEGFTYAEVVEMNLTAGLTDQDKRSLNVRVPDHLSKLQEANFDNLEPETSRGHFQLRLESYGENKISVIRVVRVFTGLDLLPAKNLVESLPQNIPYNCDHARAHSFLREIESVGGSGTVVSV